MRCRLYALSACWGSREFDVVGQHTGSVFTVDTGELSAQTVVAFPTPMDGLMLVQPVGMFSQEILEQPTHGTKRITMTSTLLPASGALKRRHQIVPNVD